jgi:hypothetical protein
MRRWCRRGITGGRCRSRRLSYVLPSSPVNCISVTYRADEQQVHQGYFDILFPTNFPVMELLYQALTGKLTRVMSHEDFLKRWALVEETETKSGENPLLTWYKNASVMTTV